MLKTLLDKFTTFQSVSCAEIATALRLFHKHLVKQEPARVFYQAPESVPLPPPNRVAKPSDFFFIENLETIRNRKHIEVLLGYHAEALERLKHAEVPDVNLLKEAAVAFRAQVALDAIASSGQSQAASSLDFPLFLRWLQYAALQDTSEHVTPATPSNARALAQSLIFEAYEHQAEFVTFQDAGHSAWRRTPLSSLLPLPYLAENKQFVFECAVKLNVPTTEFAERIYKILQSFLPRPSTDVVPPTLSTAPILFCAEFLTASSVLCACALAEICGLIDRPMTAALLKEHDPKFSHIDLEKTDRAG